MAAPTPYRRDSPFLTRVWKSVTQITQQVSSTNGDKSAAGDQTPRPNKRRRITEDSLDAGADSSLDSLFRDTPEDVEKALRIEVLKIGHRGGNHDRNVDGFLNGHSSPVNKNFPVIRARCRLTICRFKSKVELRVIYCDSQTCDIKLLRGPDDVCRTARVYLPQPFHVAADKIFVERDDEEGFSWADKYLIQTELESAGDPSWPPFELLHGEEYHRPSLSPSRQWVLSSQFYHKFVKGPRFSTNVTLRTGTGDQIETDLEMDTDLRWSTSGIEGIAARSLDETTPPESKVPVIKGALEPLTNGHVNGRVENLTNGHRNDDQDGMDDEDDVEGEAITPSRSLRMRDKPQNYNLKLLSDKARGKELKERKKRKDAAAAADSGQVTWLLPSGGRAALENWSCMRCFVMHSSIEQLKQHVSAHPDFKYTFDHTPRGGWRIALSLHGQDTPRSNRTSGLLEPPSPEEAESDLGEDLTPQGPAPQPRPKLTSQRSMPARPRETKQVVPNNKQPIFDRLSKALLEPGSRVDEPPVDKVWLMQKHRDIIKDYTDVHSDEKEYISEWDAFSITRKATLAPHLQEVYLEFLEEKSPWLAASQNRMNEAMKHLTYLKARDALTEKTVGKALDITRRARSQARNEPAGPAKSPPKDIHQSVSGCAVCGFPVSGPSQLICSNLECDKPLYHDDCIRDDAKIPVNRRNWRCNDCCAKEAAA
ncbi:hypothetical protein BJ170DRAFT_45456 [Xylariales sp. AK1849]|nr:hypothetical protein BJ170DRAFT_45456 [Xylariales sp. AK1849]